MMKRTHHSAGLRLRRAKVTFSKWVNLKRKHLGVLVQYSTRYKQRCPIEYPDALHDLDARDGLLKGGGRIRVPCVKIEESNGETRWLYDLEAINQYMEQRFAH